MALRYDIRNRIEVGLLVVFVAFFGSVSTLFAQATSKQTSMPSAEQVAQANITYEVISVEGGGYGYDIYMDGKKLIHQPNIPAIAGVAGFRKKEDSKRVAELVIRKLKNREMPPAITPEELRQLKVID